MPLRSSLTHSSRAGVLLGATALAVTSTFVVVPTAHAAPTLLDLTRVLTLRNMLNGPIQLNVLANTRNEGAFVGATTTVIGESEAPGLEAGIGETTVPLKDGTQAITVTETIAAGHLTPGEHVVVTLIGIDRTAAGLPISTATLTKTLTCGQRDSAGTLTCS
ncbi:MULTISPECIES: hypothetical protein [unclassified Streptomyces]|uniref:Uncharacterized protein n=1 Tax=Streptomyces sp. NBC_00060 TaxID=2975636 RepID=A0AAU2HGD4_9ACTN